MRLKKCDICNTSRPELPKSAAIPATGSGAGSGSGSGSGDKPAEKPADKPADVR